MIISCNLSIKNIVILIWFDKLVIFLKMEAYNIDIWSNTNQYKKIILYMYKQAHANVTFKCYIMPYNISDYYFLITIIIYIIKI